MQQLFSNSPVRKLRKGQILIYEGDAVQNIFWLINGYVKVFNILPNGTQRTMIIYAPDDAFPLTSFLSGAGVARYFYECMTDVELNAMPQTTFQEKIKGNLEMGEKLIAYTYALNRQFIDRIETLSAHSARHKVAALLAYLISKTGADSNDTSVRLSIPLTTQDIADMCSLARETASVQLTKLKRDGTISGTRHLIINKAKLKKALPD